MANSIEYMRFISVFFLIEYEKSLNLYGFMILNNYVSVDYLLTPLLLEGEEEEEDLEPEDPLELLEDLPEDPL